MANRILHVLASTALSVFLSGTGNLVQGGVLAQLDRSVTIGPKGAQTLVPDYAGQSIVVRGSGAASSRLLIYESKTGRLAVDTNLVLPDVARIQIRHAAIAQDGTIAVTAALFGRQGEFVSSILWLDSNGHIQRVVRTSPFAAARLVFAPDGSLWAAGRLHDDKFETAPDHDILRKYDAKGAMCGSALPLRGLNTAVDKHPGTSALLMSSGTRLGVYVASTNEWFELDFDGNPLGRWQLPPLPAGLVVSGAGFTDAHGPVLSLLGPPTAAAPQVAKRNVKILQFDRSRTALVEAGGIDELPPNRGTAVVIGADGDSVVLYESPDRISWLKIRE